MIAVSRKKKFSYLFSLSVGGVFPVLEFRKMKDVSDHIREMRKLGTDKYSSYLLKLAETEDPRLVVNLGAELLKDEETGTWLEGLTAAAVCGKLFGGLGSSEVGYSCLQCAVDSTCVICVDCFDEDLHRGHEWRMIPVSGMCDCGDIEGWAVEGCCKKHRGFSDDVDPTDCLSSETKQIAKAVCGTFCEILSACCLEVEAKRQEEVAGDVNDDFPWRFTPATGGARNVVGYVLQLLVSLAQIGSPTCRIINNSICDRVAIPNECETSILHSMMAIIHTSCYTKGLAGEILKLAMSLIADPELKYHLAVYISKYPTAALLKWMNKGEGLAVQFLTVPRIAMMLEKPNQAIGSPGLFHGLTSAMCKLLSEGSLSVKKIPNYKGILFNLEGYPSLSTSMGFNYSMKQFDVCCNIFDQIKFCFTATTCATYFLSEKTLRERYLMHLLMLQNSFACYRRDTATDIEGEEPAQHELRLLRFTHSLVHGVEQFVNIEEANNLNDSVITFLDAFISNTLDKRDVEESISWLAVNDSYHNPEHGVYYQIALHRFFSCICSLELLKFPDASLTDISQKFFKGVAKYSEHVIQLIVIRAQCRGGMWRRNHMGIHYLSDWYLSDRNFSMPFLKQPEYFLLQLYASYSPSQFVVHMAHRYRAHHPLVPTGENDDDREHNIVGHLLRTIVTIATDRFRFSKHKNTQRQRIITELATGAKKYSKISVSMLDPVEDTNDAEKDEILEEVADLTERMGKSMFSLKKEIWSEINPYCLSWEESLLQKADAEYVASGSERPLIPVAKWIEPPKAFKLLVGVLHNKFSLSIAICVIRAARSKAIDDGDLRVALDLIILSMRTRSEFNEASKEMLRSENRFYSSRNEEGVNTIAPSGINWIDGEINDVAEILLKETTYGDTPFGLLVELFTNTKAKELRAAINDIAVELQMSGVEGSSEVVEKLTGCSTKEEKKQAKARKAKGRAKQQAAMQAMKSQSQSFDFLSLSDEESESEEEVDDEVTENRTKSLHHTVDSGWMTQEGDKCCLCQLDTSPNQCSQVGLIALATRGAGMQQCFKSVCNDVSSCTHPPDGKTNAFNHPLLTKTGHEIVHSCGHLLHPDCLESHLSLLKHSHEVNGAILLRHEYRGFAVLNIPEGEYLCPLCGRIANTLIPVCFIMFIVEHEVSFYCCFLKYQVSIINKPEHNTEYTKRC